MSNLVRQTLPRVKAQKELGRTPLPEGPVSTAVAAESRLAKHVFFLVAGVLPVYWLLQQPGVPSVTRKFAWSVILPVRHCS